MKKSSEERREGKGEHVEVFAEEISEEKKV